MKSNPGPKPQSPFFQTIRKIFLASIIASASYYAAGEVTEYFHTGGQDGRGIDGFTVFESDRRHR